MDKKNSKQDILREAKVEFMAKGFKDASLRQIVKRAGVTTGAFYAHFKDKEALFETLVLPAVATMEQLYENTLATHDGFYEEPHVLEHKMWQQSKVRMEQHLENIYTHFDAFKLLITCSEGTKYARYVYTMLDKSLEATKGYFKFLEEQGIAMHNLPDKELKILIQTHYTSIYEVVVSDMSYEEGLAYVHTISDFFSAGWKKVLAFSKKEK